MPQKPRVFIVEPSRFNTSSAARYGEAIHISKSPLNVMNTDSFPEKVLAALSEQKFDPKVDYLCLTGSQLSVALFLATTVAVHGAVKLLVYDARDSSYRERLFDPLGVNQRRLQSSTV